MIKEINYEVLDAAVAQLSPEGRAELQNFMEILEDMTAENAKLAELAEAQALVMTEQEKHIVELKKELEGAKYKVVQPREEFLTDDTLEK
jgi:DNA-binding PadR family transcriptional regulator